MYFSQLLLRMVRTTMDHDSCPNWPVDDDDDDDDDTLFQWSA